jgi:hypothetical protein
MGMSNTIRSLVIALLLVTEAGAEPIKLDPSNPHYYTFNGQPTILITSAEHYGAVINLDFDYVAYLDALKAYGLNYTRIWPGALLEMVGEFTKDNTMGPRPDRTIVPWLRSNERGYVYGGNKFDLDKWDYYVATPGKYAETLVLDLRGGTYQADWVDPASGSVLNSLAFTHQGGSKMLVTPEHAVDIALRIKRTH